MTASENVEMHWRALLTQLSTLLGVADRESFAEVVPDASANDRIEPRSLAVLRHLDRALNGAPATTASICRALGRLKSKLTWRQNANYSERELLDGYAYCELAGPNGHVRHSRVALGVLLLGPRVTYPEHVHPAGETYAVVSGQAQWLQGDRIWRTREPGERIRHGSMEVHAMRTLDAPLLAAYVWQDHLDTAAQMLERSAQPPQLTTRRT